MPSTACSCLLRVVLDSSDGPAKMELVVIDPKCPKHGEEK